MSFPRAKLQRFNDTQSCAPAPGAYDPKFDTKVKGAVIEKKERFAVPKCPSVDLSESISSVGSDKSVPYTLPVLRTPVPQRKAAAKEAYRGNKVTCCEGNGKERNGKRSPTSVDHDAVVHDLEAQISTLNNRITELEYEIRTLQECQRKLEEQHESQLLELRRKHADAVALLDEQTSKCSELKERLCSSETLLTQSQEYCSKLELKLSSLREQCEQHLQTRNELQSQMFVLEGERERYVTGRVEVEELKKANAGLAVKLQDATRIASEMQELKQKVLSVETEKHDLEKKLVAKQDMILSLQSELSSAAVELEEARLEAERLASKNLSLRQDHETEMDL